MKHCQECRCNDFTVARRPRSSVTGLRVLCAACNLDLNRAGSTVAQVPVPARVEQDRYAQMAARYGVS